MKRILAIRTEDKEYAEELAKKFNKDEECIFQTFVFTDEEAYLEFLSSNNVDVLLCDEELMESTNREKEAGLVFGLSEVFSVHEGVKEDNIIFKYQASERIMDEIMVRFRHVLQKGFAKETVNTGNKRIICVCSPVGGCGSSTYALALASYYSRKSRTLFFSFDPFYVLPGTDKDHEGKDLSDIIFYVNGMEPYLMEFIKSITIRKGDLECISGVSHWFDLYDMSPENMYNLINAVCHDPDYKNVIIDLGMIGAAGIEVLMAAQKLYVPVKNDPGSMVKLKEWKRQLRFCGKDEIVSKIREVHIPEDESLKVFCEYENLLSGRLGKFIEESEG